jgi:luciferase family oxidoreductase group 1
LPLRSICQPAASTRRIARATGATSAGLTIFGAVAWSGIQLIPVTVIPLSVLELGRVRENSTRRAALDEARELGRHVEGLGYRRIWVAEHHNMPAVTTAAASLVIAHIASGTTTIRVGAGGIMLPNHAPYVIAEQFGTLETLFPGRIDLGLGRAPGTDQPTLRALRRDAGSAETFPQDVLELQAYLAPAAAGQRIEAVPGSGTQVPLWILGSSLFGAQLAAELGLPYAFASHFAPQWLDRAIAIYRERFQPSRQLSTPYVMVGVNVIAAESDDEARRLWTSQQMSFADLLRGTPRLLRPPVDDIDTYWQPHEKMHASQMLACSVVGSGETVRAGLQTLVERTKADELIVVSDVFDFDRRLRSFELVARAARAIPAAGSHGVVVASPERDVF